MFVNLNDSELLALVEKHCGRRLKENQPPCKRCESRMGQARIIRWQKSDMWKRHRAKYYDMSKEDQDRYDDDNRRFINGLRKKREDEKARQRQADAAEHPETEQGLHQDSAVSK